MRFIAAIDTRIYGKAYAQGSDVDITGWSRTQILQFLDNGIMAPSHLSAAAVNDALEIRGANGLEVDTIAAIDRSIVTISLLPQDLSWLTDTDVAGAGDGDTLIYDEVTGHWTATSLTYAQRLDELEDVDVTTNSDGWTLYWSAIEGKWRAAAPGARSLEELTDVSVLGAQDGEALIFDFSSGTWMPGSASAVPGPPGPAAWAVPEPWSSSTQYVAGPPASIVTHVGSSYVALQSSLNRNPSSQTAYWRLIAAKGDKGDTGDVGPASTIPGPANTISIGSVTSDVTPEASMTGTSPAQILNLVLPKGDKGDIGPSGASVPGGGVYSIIGEALVQPGSFKLYNDTGTTLSITKVRLSAGQSPLGDDLVVDINQDGSTIFTTQSNRPRILAGQVTGVSPAPDAPSWTDGSYLTVDVDQIGSSYPGSDVLISLVIA